MAISRPTDAHGIFAGLFNARDLEGLVDLYEEGAKFVVPQGEVVGKDAIRTELARILDLHGTMEMETVGIIEGQGVAVTSSNWRLVGERGQVLLTGESVEVLRQTNGQWLVAI